MGYKQQLEDRIRELYAFICEHQKIIQVSDRPEEKLASEQAVDRHWQQIERYLQEYIPLCRYQQVDVPDDLAEIIAARFPYFLEARWTPPVDLEQPLAPSPGAGVASSMFLTAMRVLGHYHEVLKEWKELHNLLQEVMTSLAPLIGALELALGDRQIWNVDLGLRLWRQVYIQLRRLESFAREIRYIDEPFDDTNGRLRGPTWMVEVATLQRELDGSLRDGDVSTGYNLAIELSDTCFTYLYRADKYLRDTAGEICALSGTLLRSIE